MTIALCLGTLSANSGAFVNPDFSPTPAEYGNMYISDATAKLVLTLSVPEEEYSSVVETETSAYIQAPEDISDEISAYSPWTDEGLSAADDYSSLSDFSSNSAPISELDVPENIALDDNGIPTEYKYCTRGKATAYTGDPATASGRTPMPGHVAVDPNEYPYGTELYIVSADGNYVYGYCVAADTGGFVNTSNIDVDLYMDNEQMCDDWGRRDIVIYVL